MSGTHSILSPSKGAMILRCSAALGMSKHVPNPPTQYSAEGTAYHELAAHALTHGVDCSWWVGRRQPVDGFEFTINEEDAAHAQKYVDAIRRLPGQQFYEVRLDTSEVVGVPGQGGTADAVTLDFDHNTIHVDDLKFGRGEIVDAHDNEQLLQYGAAALLKYAMVGDWHYLRIGIHQPRVNHYSDQVWAVDKVWEWVEASKPRFRRAYELYQDPTKITKADFTPTEKGCRWCPIRGTCPARTDKILGMFPVVGKAEAPPTQMDDAKLLEARERVDEIEQWCKDIKEEFHKRGVVEGRPFAGWKVVQGRKGNRKWADPEKAESKLEDELGVDAYKPREIISPADAEKAFKKAKQDFSVMRELIAQSDGALSLERETTSKPAVDRQMPEFPIAEPLA